LRPLPPLLLQLLHQLVTQQLLLLLGLLLLRKPAQELNLPLVLLPLLLACCRPLARLLLQLLLPIVQEG
jgi:hypothetical protein